MKIVFITHCLSLGGTTTFLFDMCTELNKVGHQTYIFGATGKLVECFQNINCQVTEINELLDHSTFIYPIYFRSFSKKFRSSYIYYQFERHSIKCEVRSLKNIFVNLIMHILNKEMRNSFNNGSASLIFASWKLRKSLRIIEPDVVFSTQIQPTMAALIARKYLKRKFPIYEFVMGIKNTMDLPAPWSLNREKLGDKILVTTGEIQSMINSIRPEKFIINVGNCIDTSKYRPQSTSRRENTRKYLNIQSSQFVILCVFSSDIYISIPLQVCNSFIKLLEETNNGYLVIIGPEEFSKKFHVFQSESTQVLGKNRIFFLGSISNKLEDFYNLADLYIGVGRTAREAMSCSIPTIVLGPTGYSGIVTPLNVENIRYYNFTGRENEDKANNFPLLNDIKFVYHMDKEERLALGYWGRNYILENDSIPQLISILFENGK